MQNQHTPLVKHYLRALGWLAAVAAMAASPILFLHFIGWLSEEDLTVKEIEALNAVRYPVFICCSVVACVLMSWLQSSVRLNTGIARFAIYWSPFILLLYVFLKYLLLYVQFSDKHDFGPGRLSTSLIILYTVVYGLFGRLLYELKKYNAGRNVDLHHSS